MKKTSKKITKSTFSTCPAWKNNKQKAKYDNEMHILQKDISFLNKMPKNIYGM